MASESVIDWPWHERRVGIAGVSGSRFAFRTLPTDLIVEKVGLHGCVNESPLSFPGVYSASAFWARVIL
jgi:hypothetical protein